MEPPPPPPDRLVLQPATFSQLPGWSEDPLAAALPALAASCRRLVAMPPDRPLGPPQAGVAGDWRPLCRAAAGLAAGDDTGLRALLEAELTPWAATNNGDPEGFFTGYYEPTLRGSHRRSARYSVPLYLRPPELVDVDLGLFRDELTGQRIAGRLDGKALRPFADRSAIDAGALAGRGLELLWVDDPVDAFFLQVQGSGRVELAGGDSLRVGYAGQNGHPYTAIGRVLVERGELTLEKVSLQSIRRWLAEHPEAAAELMAANASYVFFRRLSEPGPVGSLGVVLTPGRSLAVDATFLPLGPPVWLDGSAPSPVAGEEDRPLRRLLLAQDTGGAIRGPVRGDLFWGPGEEAEWIAGHMRHPGRLWLLLPRATAESATGTQPTAAAPTHGVPPLPGGQR